MAVLLAAVGLAMLIGALLTAGVAGAALRRAVRFATLAARPSRDVAARDPGPCRLRGFVNVRADLRAGAPMPAPLTRRAAALYELTLSHAGNVFMTDKRVMPCTISDGTAEVELDLAAAELFLSAPRSWTGAFGVEAPPGIDEPTKQRVEGAIAELARKKSADELPLVVKLEERVVSIGDTLYVSGVRGPDGSFMSGRPLVVCHRDFGELARVDALLGVMCTGFALVLAGVGFSLMKNVLARFG